MICKLYYMLNQSVNGSLWCVVWVEYTAKYTPRQDIILGKPCRGRLCEEVCHNLGLGLMNDHLLTFASGSNEE